MNAIFVFGSNLAGRHGAGAALEARKRHGAQLGIGAGLTGASYAIPTKDAKFRTRALQDIADSVEKFKGFARSHLDLRFAVTRIGCGRAGFRDEQIAPMFEGVPRNCILPGARLRFVNAPKAPLPSQLDLFEVLQNCRRTL